MTQPYSSINRVGIPFAALCLSHRRPLARYALIFWQAVSAVRAAKLAGLPPPLWAHNTLVESANIGPPAIQARANAALAEAANPTTGAAA